MKLIVHTSVGLPIAVEYPAASGYARAILGKRLRDFDRLVRTVFLGTRGWELRP